VTQYSPASALPELRDILAARERIASMVHRTPLLTSQHIDAISGARLFFKAEHLQRCGAFKARGASNAVASLSEEAAACGVATHSSGNHGAALAMAAAMRGIPAWVVMPDNAPRCKRAATASYGAKIVPCKPTMADREHTLAALVEEHRAIPVHPYEDSAVIAGQGTVALELIEQLDDIDTVVIPVGGGGLFAGMAIALRALRPDIRLIAAEPAGADDAAQAFRTGERVSLAHVNTIADGLRATLGRPNFLALRQYAERVLTVREDNIIQAMQLQWSRMKQVVEPSGAVTLAAILEYPELFKGQNVACVITGGNTDLDQLPWRCHHCPNTECI
jgi:threonine dehydratase